MAWNIQKHTITFSGPMLPEIIGRTHREEFRAPMLTVRSIKGREAVGELFEYAVIAEVENPDWLGDPRDAAQIDLAPIVNTPATIAIQFAGIGTYRPGEPGYTAYANIGADTRYISGEIAAAKFRCVEDRAAVYEFVLRPSAYTATQNGDSKIYHGSVTEVLEELLRGYGLTEWHIGGPWGSKQYYPPRDYIRQAWESDWTFAMRLMEEWGLFFWFEHSEHHHTLVISDMAGSFHRHGVAYEKLRFHTGGRIDEEHISELEVAYTLTPGKATLNDHNYAQPRNAKSIVPNRQEYEDARGTASEHIEIYAPGDFVQPDARHTLSGENDMEEEGRHLARVKLQALRCKGLRAKGKGHLSCLQPGRTFKLFNYPQDKANREYIVLSCDLEITQVGTSSGDWRTYSLNAGFELQPADECYRLPQITPRPRIDHFERAVIVAPQDNEIWIDDRNRALVKFSWDRSEGFEGDNSIWVRLGMQWQGSQMGTVFHARAGQEVLIGYEEGDCDRPFIAHFVVNKFNTPLWELPRNDALSGIVTKSLGYGLSWNHLGFDDTQGRQQAQLATDHGKSSLALGFNTRIDGRKGRQDARGEGFELRTDLWGVLRAAMGLLLTSWGRAGAAGKVKELAETIARLTQARDLQEQLATVACKNGAQDATGHQGDVAKDIKEANAALRGNGRTRPDEFPEFERPDIVVSSAANLHTSAAGATHLASEKHTAISAGGNVVIGSARSFLASVFEKVSLYAHKAGVYIGAASGKVQIRAQSDEIEAIANQDFKLVSEGGTVYISAKNKIVLTAGGSRWVVGPEGVQGFTPAEFLVHAGTHATDGPMSVPSHFAQVAPYPMQISCAALATATSSGSGAGENVVAAPAASTLAPAPVPAPALATDMLPAAGNATAIDSTLAGAPAQSASTAARTIPVNDSTGELCQRTLRDIPNATVTWDMETGNYWGIYADGRPWLDDHTHEQKFVQLEGASGTFDIAFGAASKTITMRVIVLVVPMRVRKNNPSNPLTIDSVPYEAVRDRDARNAGSFIKEPRPVSEITNLPQMKSNIESYLNKNGYKLTIKNCPKSTTHTHTGAGSCATQITVKFVIDFVTDPRAAHHAQVNLYPMAARADSGNWGEQNVQLNDKKTQWIPIPNEHVQMHETGHLFSFPDEYFDQGGAVYKGYIDEEQKIKFALATASSDKNMWQGIGDTTLMGPGVYSAGVKVPSYYLNRVRDWFGRQTGWDWKVVPHIEA